MQDWRAVLGAPGRTSRALLKALPSMQSSGILIGASNSASGPWSAPGPAASDASLSNLSRNAAEQLADATDHAQARVDGSSLPSDSKESPSSATSVGDGILGSADSLEDTLADSSEDSMADSLTDSVEDREASGPTQEAEDEAMDALGAEDADYQQQSDDGDEDGADADAFTQSSGTAALTEFSDTAAFTRFSIVAGFTQFSRAAPVTSVHAHVC